MTHSDDPFADAYLLELRPTSEFDYNAAKSKLASLTLGFGGAAHTSVMLPGDTYDEDGFVDDGGPHAGLHGHMLRLSGCIPLDSRLTVSVKTARTFQTPDRLQDWLCRRHYLVPSTEACCKVSAWGCSRTSVVSDYSFRSLLLERHNVWNEQNCNGLTNCLLQVHQCQFIVRSTNTPVRESSERSQSRSDQGFLWLERRSVSLWTVSSSSQYPARQIPTATTIPPPKCGH